MRRSTFVAIGEAMIELRGVVPGAAESAFGGDVINTAVYLARTCTTLDIMFATALGNDGVSRAMATAWQAEGVDTQHVLYLDDAQPGLYLIQAEGHGERSFLYWRRDSAARRMIEAGLLSRLSSLVAGDFIYVTGITLAILPPNDREQLYDWLTTRVAHGVHVVFDPNYRPILWESDEAARQAYRRMAALTDLVLATDDDEAALWGAGDPQTITERLRAFGVESAVIKCGAAGCHCLENDRLTPVPTVRVIEEATDTTGAGDAFNAALLSRWCNGSTLLIAADYANHLAGQVIQYSGAIIAASCMPDYEH